VKSKGLWVAIVKKHVILSNCFFQSAEVGLRQVGSKINGTYQYPRDGGVDWALRKNFLKNPIDGQLIGDVAIFRWTDVYGDDAWAGIGYWKVKNDDEAKGYWFHKGEVPEFSELINDLRIILKLDSKNDRKWDLARQKVESSSTAD
jgi:hypothetical protein